ncbi:MAG TPA: MalM family protein [Rhodanobacteraceae bacterium]
MSYRALSHLGLILSSVLLAACSASLPLHGGSPIGAAETASLNQARTALAKADLCCTRFSQFDFQQSLPAEPKRFDIGPQRPVADFGGSRSWFLAFTLPADAKVPYGIVFKSTLNGRWLHHSYLFAPSVVLLDANYQPLRVKDVQLCEYMGWTRSRSGAFGHITINNANARYLVVYSSSAQINGSTYWEQSPTAFSANQPVQMASSGNYQIPHGPNGVLYVGRLTDHYRKAVDNAICGSPNAHAPSLISQLHNALSSHHATSATQG